MAMQIECPQCDRRLRIQEECAGRKVKCPACGTVWEVPAANPTAPPTSPAVHEAGDVYSLAPLGQAEPADDAIRPVEPAPRPRNDPARNQPQAPPAASGAQELCPNCGSFLAPEAILCIECGFNRQTGRQLKTVSRRFQRQWDSGGFPYWARLVVSGVLLPLCAAPLFSSEPDMGMLLLTVWGLILLPLLGSLKRIIVTRDPDGRPVLIRQWWVWFAPCYRSVTDLEGFARIRTGAQEGGFDGRAVLYTVLLFLLCGLPGLVYALIRARSITVTLEVAGAHDGPDVEPVLVYRGTNDATMRQIGDTLKEIAGLRYG